MGLDFVYFQPHSKVDQPSFISSESLFQSRAFFLVLSKIKLCLNRVLSKTRNKSNEVAMEPIEIRLFTMLHSMATHNIPINDTFKAHLNGRSMKVKIDDL